MKLIKVAPIAAAVFASLSFSQAAAAAERVILQVDNANKGIVTALSRQLGGEVKLEADGFISVEFEGKSFDEIKGILKNPHIKLVEQDFKRTPMALYNDDAGNPIFVPVPYSKLEIGRDGTISVLPVGAPANGVEIVGRIKLVSPDNSTLDKGRDGLFRPIDGAAVAADETATLSKGMLEDSNVNVVEELTSMISLQRQFELQVKVMKTAEQTDEAHASLLRL